MDSFARVPAILPRYMGGPFLFSTPTRDPGHRMLPDLFACIVSTLIPPLGCVYAELALLDDGETLRVLSVRPNPSGKAMEMRTERDRYSDRIWRSSESASLAILDPGTDLDATREGDRGLLDAEPQSIVAVPLKIDRKLLGLLILASRQTLTDHDATPVLPLSEFLALAVHRERIWNLAELRHRRREKLEAVLPKIAESLDVRRVFVSMSQVIKDVIPHDVLAFALLSSDHKGVRVQAATHQGVLELPEYRFSNTDEALDANWRFLLAYDLIPLDEHSLRARISATSAPTPIEVVVRPGPAWMRFVTEAKIRSILRVPIRSKERPVGGVAFMSCRSDAYDEEDGNVASRIGDHVALALAHQNLAEEERRIALAEERAYLLQERVETLSRELDRVSAHRVIGQSPGWKTALELATQVATTDTTVLITGESGTGKEVIARYVHRGSKRSRGPFVALNCAALPEQLLESELFGHERGAFTGAVEARAGKLEQASGGILFLDEVSEMSPAVQAKFLRVLQEREFQRVGGTKTMKADVRIVAATNRDPRAAIAAGSFREDLYYRLGVFEIHLPSLRERPEDILILAEAFLEEFGRSVGRPAAGLSEEAREQLLTHAWPGNVRELRNAIERAVILCQGGLIRREHLPISVSRLTPVRVAMAAPQAAEFPIEGVPLETVERELLEKAMAKAGNNKSQAAKLLGLSRGQLYSLLRRHGLTQARR